jgi:hypothetical protein
MKTKPIYHKKGHVSSPTSIEDQMEVDLIEKQRSLFREEVKPVQFFDTRPDSVKDAEVKSLMQAFEDAIFRRKIEEMVETSRLLKDSAWSLGTMVAGYVNRLKTK